MGPIKTSYILRYIKYLSNHANTCGVTALETHNIYKNVEDF